MTLVIGYNRSYNMIVMQNIYYKYYIDVIIAISNFIKNYFADLFHI